MTPRLAHFARNWVTGLLALAFVHPAVGGLYKCVDSQNRTYYQDMPCQEMKAERLSGSLATIAGKEEMGDFFWKATKGKDTLYLLGSLNFGAKALFPLPERVTDAFDGSDVVVVEADINTLGIEEMANLLHDKGHYTDNGKLEDRIKPFTWKKTLELANKVGLDEQDLHTLKPWLAALRLTALAYKQEGYSAELGIDKSIIRQAQGKKTVMELENVQDQINSLDQLSDQDQEQVLLHALQESSHGRDYRQGIVDAWKRGDAEAMDLMVRQGFDPGQGGSKLFQALILDRNERMANKLADLANDGRAYFAVVGAGHLGGAKGIIKLLEQKGFAITQP
jgi:uncharacterized protein YbaP (TraB family)